MEDSRIIALYWQKNADAIQETNRKYGAYCFAIADNILHSREDAEECVNDTWLNAWNAMPPQKPARLRPFLAKITRNLAFNRYNARSAGKRGGGGLVLVRRYFFTEPVAEIAGRYGLTANHVMVILSRTRKKLRVHLVKEGFVNESE